MLCLCSEAIVSLATQPDEPVAGPLNLEQTRCTLVVRFARDAARVGARPRATDESISHVLCLMIGATFGQEPFGVVSEIMLSQFRDHVVIAKLALSVSISQYWNRRRILAYCRTKNPTGRAYVTVLLFISISYALSTTRWS